MSDPGIITIVMSTQNGDRHLAAQIDSIRSQSDPHWRLLIHDDGSTDATASIIADFARRDERIELAPWIETGGSVASIYLRLAALIETPLFGFADQDDVWLPSKLALQRQRLVEAGLDDPDRVAMVVCDAQPVDSQLQPLGATVRQRQSYKSFADVTVARLLMANPIPGHTIIGTRALAHFGATAGDVGPSMHDWWMALCAAAHGRLVGVESTGVLYRQHERNVRGAPSGLAERVRNLARRSLAERTEAVLAPAVANAELARRNWPSELVDQHREPLAAVAACAEENPMQALMNCWRLGARLKPWPSHLALIGGSR